MVKIAKPNQDMRFDVPVIGVKTIEVMQAAGARCLALDAGKCLLLDGEKIIEAANAAGIAIVAEEARLTSMRAKAAGKSSRRLRIADQLRRAFDGSAWHGPALARTAGRCRRRDCRGQAAAECSQHLGAGVAYCGVG